MSVSNSLPLDHSHLLHVHVYSHVYSPTIFTSPETGMIVLPDDENRMIVASFVSTKHRNVTEGRTAGQTDRHDRS